MKLHMILIAVVGLSLLSCSSDGTEMMETQMQSEIIGESSMLMGDFIADAHPTTGKVTVNKLQTILTFQNFKTDSGPKLLVYLTPEVGSDDYVDLGELKGINGNYTYTIPSRTNLSKYKKVVIWCVDFSVSFGHAELK